MTACASGFVSSTGSLAGRLARFPLSRKPSLRRNVYCPSVPTSSAIFTVPMFDEYMKISGTVR